MNFGSVFYVIIGVWGTMYVHAVYQQGDASSSEFTVQAEIDGGAPTKPVISEGALEPATYYSNTNPEERENKKTCSSSPCQCDHQPPLPPCCYQPFPPCTTVSLSSSSGCCSADVTTCPHGLPRCPESSPSESADKQTNEMRCCADHDPKNCGEIPPCKVKTTEPPACCPHCLHPLCGITISGHPEIQPPDVNDFPTKPQYVASPGYSLMPLVQPDKPVPGLVSVQTVVGKSGRKRKNAESEDILRYVLSKKFNRGKVDGILAKIFQSKHVDSPLEPMDEDPDEAENSETEFEEDEDEDLHGDAPDDSSNDEEESTEQSQANPEDHEDHAVQTNPTAENEENDVEHSEERKKERETNPSKEST